MVCAVLANCSNNSESSDKNWKKQIIAENQRNMFANSLLHQGLRISRIEFLKNWVFKELSLSKTEFIKNWVHQELSLSKSEFIKNWAYQKLSFLRTEYLKTLCFKTEFLKKNYKNYVT